MQQTEELKIFIDNYFSELKRTIDELDIKQITTAVNILITAYNANKKVFILGNGGSASTASHMACDLGKGTLKRVYDNKEKRFKVISLTDNVALITAYANDLSFDNIFLQQLRNLVNKGDVVIALSGSGNSKNLIKAVEYARKRKAKIIGLLGFTTGGKLGSLVDCAIIAKSNHYGPCEDIQLILDHVIVSWLARIKLRRDGQRNILLKNKALPYREI